MRRWIRKARDEIAELGLREGDRIRHRHRDTTGVALRESITSPGFVLVSWDGGGGSLEEPFDLEVSFAALRGRFPFEQTDDEETG